MMIKEIADRLEAWRDGHGRHSRLYLKDITILDAMIADLRALEGKTVLPVEITQAIEDGDTLYIESGVDGGHCAGTILAMLEHARGNSIGLTPAAALDALAEELSRIDKPNG